MLKRVQKELRDIKQLTHPGFTVEPKNDNELSEWTVTFKILDEEPFVFTFSFPSNYPFRQPSHPIFQLLVQPSQWSPALTTIRLFPQMYNALLAAYWVKQGNVKELSRMKDLPSLLDVLIPEKNKNYPPARTLLYIACKYGQVKVVKYLLKSMPLIDYKNGGGCCLNCSCGETPFEIAKTNNFTKIMRLLIAHHQIKRNHQDVRILLSSGVEAESLVELLSEGEIEPFRYFINIYTLPKLVDNQSEIITNNSILKYMLAPQADLILNRKLDEFKSLGEYFSYHMSYILSCRLKKRETLSTITLNRATVIEGAVINRANRTYLGNGANGAVYSVLMNNVPVAEKISNNIGTSEIEIMNGICEHDGVVKLLHHYNQDGIEHLFMEKMDDSLSSFSITEPTIIELVQILFSLVKVSDTMKYLHSKNVIHYDIKPNNILVKKMRIDGVEIIDNVKLSDFDVSLTVDKPETYSCTTAGTLYYMAPELRNKQQDTVFVFRALDIFSFGVTMHTFISGYRPANMADVFGSFISVAQLVERFNFLTQEQAQKIHLLGMNCTHIDPKERPTFEDIFDELTEITTQIYLKFMESTMKTTIE